MESKKGFQMSFAWIFAMIVGTAILFIAVYAATQFINISEIEVTSKTAKAITNVLDQVQTTVEEGSSDIVPLSVETRIFTSCNVNGDFGETLIEVSEKIRFGNKWSVKGSKVPTSNAYLFAEEVIEGKEINFLIFSFTMPYKTGDISIAYTDPYCFVDAPLKVENVISGLSGGNPNLIVTSDKSSCPENSITVCFGSSNCEINVQCSGNCESGLVLRQGESRKFFVDNLLYGAIFSSKENYECNTERLVKRLGHLSSIYEKKSQFVAIRGCNTGLRNELFTLKGLSKDYENTGDLILIKTLAEEINEINEVLECQLY